MQNAVDEGALQKWKNWSYGIWLEKRFGKSENALCKSPAKPLNV